MCLHDTNRENVANVSEEAVCDLVQPTRLIGDPPMPLYYYIKIIIYYSMNITITMLEVCIRPDRLTSIDGQGQIEHQYIQVLHCNETPLE